MDKTIVLEIVGTNLKSAKAVRLVQTGASPLLGIDITTAPTMIHCNVTIPSGAIGSWNPVVVTEVGETKGTVLFTTSQP